MPSDVMSAISRRKPIQRNRLPSALLLAALLLLFFNCVRAGRYDLQNQNLKLATSLTYLAGDEMKLEASIAALLLRWSILRVAMRSLELANPLRVVVPAQRLRPAGVFVRTLRPRAPPNS